MNIYDAKKYALKARHDFIAAISKHGVTAKVIHPVEVPLINGKFGDLLTDVKAIHEERV
jgi:hypothetical protein